MAIITGVSTGISLVKGVVGSLDGSNKRRQERLAKDAHEAAAQGGPANQDYLLFRQQQGGNVTRKEYDDARRPFEGLSAEQQAASGLFPFSTRLAPQQGTPLSAGLPSGRGTFENPIQLGGIEVKPFSLLLLAGLLIGGLLIWRLRK